MPKPSRKPTGSKRSRNEVSTGSADLIGGETSEERQRREQGEPARQPSRANQENSPDYPARKQPDTSESENVDRPSGESASLRSQGARSEKPADDLH